jgi:hypothetical protein
MFVVNCQVYTELWHENAGMDGPASFARPMTTSHLKLVNSRSKRASERIRGMPAASNGLATCRKAKHACSIICAT